MISPLWLFFTCSNNLYGWAMSQTLPTGGHRWMTELEVRNFDIKLVNKNSHVGYMLVVTLSYPKELHKKHRHFPLAAENVEITEKDLSPTAREALIKLKGKRKGGRLPPHKAKKLTATFGDRVEYGVHGENLAYYLSQGMKLEKVHCGIIFDQSPFLKEFVDLCTKKRKEAPTKLESNLWKKLLNSLYGILS